MADQPEGPAHGVSVREFASSPIPGLKFELLEGREGLGNLIRSPRVQKLGLAFAGFTGYIHAGRVQMLGGSEINYLSILGPGERRAAFGHLHGQSICCVVISKGLEAPVELLDLARQEKFPVLRTSALSSVAVSRISDYLDEQLAPRITIHGVLLEIFGLGVLLLGPSGIGKSECALELILRGYRLIADDCVQITRRLSDRLIGAGGERLRHHMELRGLGIFDIRELFGISSIGSSRQIDFAVRLERWRPEAEYDRLGLEQSRIEFLGTSIPLIEMPVAPGRNVSALVEVAARIQLLRQKGDLPSKELKEMDGPQSGAETEAQPET